MARRQRTGIPYPADEYPLGRDETLMNTMPVCPDCQHRAHESLGCVDSETCMCERMWTHDEHDQIANACECEHESHETHVNPAHAHDYLGVPSVTTVQTIYGAFKMCQSCADAMPEIYRHDRHVWVLTGNATEECSCGSIRPAQFNDESRTLTCANPRCENLYKAFTSTGFTAMCSSCGNVLVRLT